MLLTDWDDRALEVIGRLQQAGHQAVLVGGCIRDRLLGRPAHDYDIATSALPDETLRACEGLRCVKTGERHGTVTVIVRGLRTEVTTFRRESGYSDHRRPDQVEFTGDLVQDLARRDFTINAIAWGREGLVDPFAGREDLQQRLIRCVGRPEQRFEEDALRLLRGLRLCAELEGEVHPATAAAIRSHAPQLDYVSWERICTELVRLLCAPGAGAVLLAFWEVVVQIIPELAPCVGFDQQNPHHQYDIYTHSVKAMEQVPAKPALRLAALLHDVGKPAVFSLDKHGTGHFYGHAKVSAELTDRALRRLRLDNATRERVVALVGRHHLPVEPNRKWAGRWLSRLGEPLLLELLALKRGDALAGAPGGRDAEILLQAENEIGGLLAATPCLRASDMAVNGHDAIAAGLSGPAVGRALKELLEQVAQGAMPNERQALLVWLQERGRSG